MQPSEKAFDFPATTVTAQLATVLGQIQAVGAVGRDHANAVLAPQLAVQGVAVVGRIADHSFRPSTGETVLEGAFDEFRFMRRSAGNVAGDRKTMAVCDRHDFTAFTSASRADSSAPFFAELKLASVRSMWQFQPKPGHLQSPSGLSVIYEITSSVLTTRL